MNALKGFGYLQKALQTAMFSSIATRGSIMRPVPRSEHISVKVTVTVTVLFVSVSMLRRNPNGGSLKSGSPSVIGPVNSNIHSLEVQLIKYPNTLLPFPYMVSSIYGNL